MAPNVLDKVIQQRGTLWDLNSQVKHRVNYLNASSSVLKETFITCSRRAEIAEQSHTESHSVIS